LNDDTFIQRIIDDFILKTYLLMKNHQFEDVFS